jgi:hypothetical protein
MTKLFLAWVRREREGLKEGLALGVFKDGEVPEVVAQCRVYQAVLSVEADQLLEVNEK